MNAPPGEATGMVGVYALRCALDHSAIEFVTAIGRRKLDMSHPKFEPGMTVWLSR